MRAKIAIAAATLAVAAPAYAEPIQPSPTIVSGSLTFDGFSCASTGIACTDILATPYTSTTPPDPVAGEHGIRLTGAFNAAAGVSNDTTITYDTHSTSTVTDASIYYNGTPISSIFEQIFDIGSGALLGQLFVENPPETFTDHVDLSAPSSDIRIVKDIQYVGSGRQSTISIVDQTFSEGSTPIPEPASLMLLGTALLGGGVFARRRRS